MKISKLHIFLFFVLMHGFHQACLGCGTLQEPQQTITFDTDFKDRYTGNKYDYEGKKIVTTSQSGSGKYEDYKKGKPNIEEQNDTDAFNINLSPISWIFYLAIAIAVIFLVYILLNEGGSGLFSTKQNKKLTTYEAITAENIENTDIHALIKNAETNNDYRLAIRYYYLLVLKNLSLKNHIKFEDDKTNNDYLNEISTKPFSDKFVYTSYLYTYIWYGEFPLDSEQYAKAKSNFTTLLNLVAS